MGLLLENDVNLKMAKISGTISNNESYCKIEVKPY